MALNVSPIYQHLYKILKNKNVDSNIQMTKASAASISNKKLNTDADKLGHDLSQNMAHQDFDLRKEANQEHYREVKERLKKLDVV